METLMVSHEEGVASQVLDGFINDCHALGIQTHVEQRPKSAFAAVEDYIPTAIMVFLAKPFFDAFLKKAGEDAYVAFKKALTLLVKRAAAIKASIIISSGSKSKINSQYPFSRVVAIYSKSPEGMTLKFLFQTTGDEEYFTKATESLCDMLRNETLPRADHKPLGRTYILCYDRKSKAWIYRTRK